jgi:predicted NUDIX family NTP pyrophosphohydrolase
MIERISAGILLFRRVAGAGASPGSSTSPGGASPGGNTSPGGAAAGAGLEVLLGHPGGPFHAARDLGSWSIPKGEVEPGEDLYDVARREFEEETGNAPPDSPAIALGTIVQKGGKVVHAWALEGNLDPAASVSNTFTMLWPPGSGTIAAFPEIDRVAWFAPDEARRRVKAAQAPFVDRLEEVLRAR